MKKIFALSGILLLAAAGAWQAWLGPQWTERIPPGWRWEASFLGTGAYADADTGQLPADDYVTTYSRVMSKSPDLASPGSVWLEDHYITRDPVSNEITWEYTYRAEVDPRTGQHTAREYAGDYFVFPRQVQRQTYHMRFTTFKGLPFAYEGEEDLEGLRVYRFHYTGYAEYTEGYASTPNYAGVDVAPGQDIRCRDDKLDVTLWVEPATGELAQVAEACPSGDYVYDTATNSPLYALARWEGTTAGDDVYQRVGLIRAERQTILAATYYVPLGLLAGGLVLLAAALLNKRR
ncbi:MAG: porin PorA family protein [Anaerolineales bacterium]